MGTRETKGERGYDSNKKVKGCKRHILVDVTGLLLAVVFHRANSQERAGAKLLLERVKAMIGLMLKRLARNPAAWV